MYNELERQFVSQSKLFSRLVREDAAVYGTRPAHQSRPVIIQDSSCLAQSERKDIIDRYNKFGISYFIDLSLRKDQSSRHPLFAIAEQLDGPINLRFPLKHPLEDHPQSVARFGYDGTVKVYNVEKKDRGYREQGETSEKFEMHHDGLGSAGGVENVMLYMDGAPLWGGITYFQNIARLALQLEELDPEAFGSLFLPDALTIIRPRGKGALKVTTPVLYVNESGRAQSGFRRPSGEYIIEWRDDPVLRRAKMFLELNTEPFSPGSSFAYFTAPGHGCIIRNDIIAHGRTDFIDAPEQYRVRVLSRKWFMRTRDFAVYRHVPGISLLSQYAGLYPDLFSDPMITGEWLYVPESGKNLRRELD